MRAARIAAYGGPEQLNVEDVADPTCGPNDVLVDIHASSVNPVDYKIRLGAQRAIIRLKLPATLGMDLSGVVAEVGGSVQGFAVGDEVYSSPSHKRMGTYAERILVRPSELAHKPKSLSHQEAASLPLVALTAWDALVGSAKLQSGERVLIQAGSGGVGSVAIQLARHLGAQVFTTCSPRNAELVASLGAHTVIDYRSQDWAEVAEGVDVILESIGGDEIRKAVRAVKKGGRVACITANLPAYTKKYGPTLGVMAVGCEIAGHVMRARLTRGVGVSFVTRTPSGANLKALAEIVDAGGIKPVIDKVFPLDEIVEAHRAIETGRTRGKIVIAVR